MHLPPPDSPFRPGWGYPNKAAPYDGTALRGFSFPGFTMPHEPPAEAEAVFQHLPAIGKNLTFMVSYSKILNNSRTWPPVNAKNPTAAHAGDRLRQRQTEGVGRHLARGAGRATAPHRPQALHHQSQGLSRKYHPPAPVPHSRALLPWSRGEPPLGARRRGGRATTRSSSPTSTPNA